MRCWGLGDDGTASAAIGKNVDELSNDGAPASNPVLLNENGQKTAFLIEVGELAKAAIAAADALAVRNSRLRMS